MTRIAIDTSEIVELLTLGPQSASVRKVLTDAIFVTPVACVDFIKLLLVTMTTIQAAKCSSTYTCSQD